MKRICILFVILGMAFGTPALMNGEGRACNGLLRVSILAYSDREMTDLVWTGTTDGSLPSLRVENGSPVNLDEIIPAYLDGELYIDIRQDGRRLTDEPVRYTPLRRATPDDPGEISETMATHLNIGNPGETDDLVVHSPRTGFGVTEPSERVDINGVIGIREGAAPTATADVGKVYVDDVDGHLYYMDEGGVATDLLEETAVAGGGLIAAIGTEQVHACVDQSIHIGAHIDASSPSYTHAWTGDTSPLSASDIPNPTFLATSAGTYNLVYTITDSEGASSQYLFAITVHPLPTPSIEAYPPSGGCSGQPVVLYGDGCYEKYCWSPGPCSKMYEVTRGETYELTVVDEWGCKGTTDYMVSFLGSPVANAGSNAAECQGGTDPTLGGSPAATSGTPPYAYNWTGSGAPYLSSTGSANPTFDVGGASAGVYNLTLEVTDANGCTDTDGPVLVTVYELPVADISATSPVCPGDDITLTGSATGGTPPYSYSWTGPDGFTSIVQEPIITSATADNAGEYQLTVTDGHGCVSIVEVATVVVSTPPSIDTDPADVTQCTGTDATFSVTASGTGPFSYQWSVNGGSGWMPITGATSSSYTQTDISGTIDGSEFRCVVSGACSPAATSASATLTVIPVPEFSGGISGSAVVAPGANDETYSVTPVAGADSYLWTVSGDASIDGSATGSSVLVDFGFSTGTDVYICVEATNSCGTSDELCDTVEIGIPSGSVTFNYTGSQQTWTVPSGLSSVHIECWGAQGGHSGGTGGYAQGDLAVSSGDILYVYVGGQGGETTAGWNGGGAGATYGGGGGGGTDIRFGGTSLSDRVIVAGGGGGDSYGSYPSNGGNGGGTTGQDGADQSGYTGGHGGTQVAGGAAGCCYGSTAPGTFGAGGGTGDYHNAGGGGGWYGGGTGAAYGAAGGGSGYIGGVTGGSLTTGGRSGNGQVIISW